MTDQTLALAADFPETSNDAWRALVEKALKGGAFEKLVTKSDDGFAIQPLYPQTAPADQQPVGRNAGEKWALMQRVDHTSPDAANEQALEDLNDGAVGLTLTFAGASMARGYGLPVSVEALATALAGVHTNLIPIRLEAGPAAADAGQAFLDYAEKADLSGGDLSVSFGADPLGTLASAGALGQDMDAMTGALAALGKRASAMGLAARLYEADGRAYADAGASEGQELGATLATALAYLRALESAGHSLEEAAGMIGFTLSFDANQFLGIAKARAMRRLWARAMEACGVENRTMHLHGETAWRMMTKRDPWVNMLRVTLATFAAGVGGVDSLTVLPFTQALGLPDGFGRRIARNTQHILLDESNLYRVADPAAGSGAVESLTEELAREGWTFFQSIEAAGGMQAALYSGLVQRAIAATHATRKTRIAKRRDELTGASAFPNIHEAPVEVLDVAAIPVSVTGGTRLETPLASLRLAEDYEALRDASDKAADAGKRPSVFLANLGPVAAFTARATWAKNFFEAGGIEALASDGFASADEAVAAFKTSGADLVCLCSSDAVYADLAEDTAKAFAAAGAKTIYLAGKGGEQAEALQAAGVETFVHVGVDVLAILHQAHAKLGLTA